MSKEHVKRKHCGQDWKGDLKMTASGSYLPFPSEALDAKQPAKEVHEKRKHGNEEHDAVALKKLNEGKQPENPPKQTFDEEYLAANIPDRFKTGYGMTPEMTTFQKKHFDAGYAAMMPDREPPEHPEASDEPTSTEKRHIEVGLAIGPELFEDCMLETFIKVCKRTPKSEKTTPPEDLNPVASKKGRRDWFPNQEAMVVAFQALISELEAICYKKQILTFIKVIEDVTELKRIARVGARTNIDLIMTKMDALEEVKNADVNYYGQQYLFLLGMMQGVVEKCVKEYNELTVAEVVKYYVYF